MGQYIVFTVNKQNFAVDISVVERIIEAENPRKTPETSDYFLGVTQYSGDILPIIDLSKRLYNVSTKQDIGTKVIIITWNKNFIGFMVDDVIGVQNYSDEQFEETNKEINLSKKYMLGFIKDKEDIIIVLDINKIFDEEQEEELLFALDIWF